MKSSTLDAYYRAELLYAQVQEILHLDDQAAHDAKAIQIADLLFSVAHVDRILRAGATSESESEPAEDRAGVLGVTASMLHRSTGLSDDRTVQFRQDAARHALLPRIEEKLRDKCNDVCDIMLSELLDRTRQQASRERASLQQAPLGRQVIELPALLVEAQSLQRQRKQRLALLKRQLRTQLVEDLNRIKAMILMVSKLLVQYKQHEMPRVLRAKMEWLVAFSRAMGVRAKVLNRQILLETYPADRIEVLFSVHEALEERLQRARDEREQLEAKLHLYRSADAEYQAMAREYAFVLQGIEEKKKWIRSLHM